MPNLSNSIFKDETRMHLVQGKCNKMVTSARAGLKGRGARGNFYRRAPMT